MKKQELQVSVSTQPEILAFSTCTDNKLFLKYEYIVIEKNMKNKKHDLRVEIIQNTILNTGILSISLMLDLFKHGNLRRLHINILTYVNF